MLDHHALTMHRGTSAAHSIDNRQVYEWREIELMNIIPVGMPKEPPFDQYQWVGIAPGSRTEKEKKNLDAERMLDANTSDWIYNAIRAKYPMSRMAREARLEGNVDIVLLLENRRTSSFLSPGLLPH